MMISYSILVRVILLSVGCYIDSLQEAVKYTDIDYTVYTQAGVYLLYGKSPYEQETYRYSPLLAVLMIPNSTSHWFGKFLFCAADICIVQIVDNILENATRGKIETDKTRLRELKATICFLWSINPLSSNIASRGSADSISNLLVLWLIQSVCVCCEHDLLFPLLLSLLVLDITEIIFCALK